MSDQASSSVRFSRSHSIFSQIIRHWDISARSASTTPSSAAVDRIPEHVPVHPVVPEGYWHQQCADFFGPLCREALLTAKTQACRESNWGIGGRSSGFRDGLAADTGEQERFEQHVEGSAYGPSG